MIYDKEELEEKIRTLDEKSKTPKAKLALMGDRYLTKCPNGQNNVTAINKCLMSY